MIFFLSFNWRFLWFTSLISVKGKVIKKPFNFTSMSGVLPSQNTTEYKTESPERISTKGGSAAYKNCLRPLESVHFTILILYLLYTIYRL